MIMVERPIKYEGKMYPSYMKVHMFTQKETLLTETPFEPPLKSHEKGYGSSLQSSIRNKDMPIPLPLAKSVNKLKNNYYLYTLGVNRAL